MKPPKPPPHLAQPARLYKSAEIYVDELPSGQKVATMRFKTMQKSERGQVDSATPWVTFPLELLDGLASQLAAVASSGARWRQDAPAPDMGTTIGVYAKKIPRA